MRSFEHWHFGRQGKILLSCLACLALMALGPLHLCGVAGAAELANSAATPATAPAASATAVPAAPGTASPAASATASPAASGRPAVPVLSATPAVPATAATPGAPSPVLTPSSLGALLANFSFAGWNPSTLYIWNRSVGQTPRLPEGDSGREAILGEYGLNIFTRRMFQRGQRNIYIDIYEFASDAGAFGAYYFLRKGATTVVPRGDAASEDDASISFVQGHTFVSIYGTSQDDDESKEVVRKAADILASQIPEHGKLPQLIMRLPRLELLHGSEKFVMGSQSARRFSPAPYLGQLFPLPGKTACVADYQMREPAKERLRLMLIEYATAAEAEASYSAFVTALCEGHDQDPVERLARPSNQFRNGSSFLDVEQRGNYILLVTGARKKYSAGLLIRQFR